MNIKAFKNAGVRFSYCRYAVLPQIPYVQDVLYILQLSGEKDARNYYSPEGAANWATYIENVLLVAVAVAPRVLGMERYDDAEAKKIIAEAIMGLCPPEAKCLFNNAFVTAQEIFVGKPAPSKTASRDELRKGCGCSECKRSIREDERSPELNRYYGYELE